MARLANTHGQTKDHNRPISVSLANALFKTWVIALTVIASFTLVTVQAMQHKPRIKQLLS
ncbi:hypothetical protein Sps_03848 [Shewanella psychrophila]|uniref:Uncharacterized protein n=1 Tax=Shewanella psychrophila TaxID=225848 RepID=A0A1S6HTZ9_9GAMM|nr:hypothetical protein Sps_03848 [Shewanella psychrophila]